MNPTTMAEKPMFPTHRSSPSEGEPDALKGARPVRWGGWRKPAGAFRPLAAPSLPNRSVRDLALARVNGRTLGVSALVSRVPLDAQCRGVLVSPPT